MPIWLIFAILALALWGVWGIFPKLATSYLSPASVMVYEGIGHMVVVIATLAYLGFRPEVQAKGIAFAVLAGFVGTVGSLVFLFAISKGKASVVVPLTALYPLVTIVLALVLLHEPLTWKQGLAIVFALAALVLFSL
ncbi:MAG: DMT family transporter [SAR202 cluster bacterium]|nr:DMT family transporter [SAR202 cluster bacterium]